jgi:hypothetical protein
MGTGLRTVTGPTVASAGAGAVADAADGAAAAGAMAEAAKALYRVADLRRVLEPRVVAVLKVMVLRTCSRRMLHRSPKATVPITITIRIVEKHPRRAFKRRHLALRW